ncbi:MAG: hypothetical protein JSV79_12020 [Armatimonadota bacterium]|nr:MAG: hypothetical protein JSV79_12020 [Armatimonadota bacterium]
MTRTPRLLFCLALLLLAQPVAGPALAGSEERRVTLDFADAPLEDALRVLFQGRPYAFTLDPGLEDCRVTMDLRDVTFQQVLRSVTLMLDLLCEKKGNVYHIYRKPQAEIEAEEEAARKAHEERKRDWETKQQMLYWTDYGGQAQLRLRVFPYPGNEKVLWRSPGNVGLVSVCLPSPSYQWVAFEWDYQWFVVRVPDGESMRIGKDSTFAAGVWRDDHTLALLTARAAPGAQALRASEFSYDAETGDLVQSKADVGDYAGARAGFLESSYAEQIGLLRSLIKGAGGKFGLGLVLPIRDREAAAAVLRGAGYRHYGLPRAPLPSSKAAFSPDGRYLATTTGADAVFILLIHQWSRAGGKETEYSASVSEVIPVTKLVAYEGISLYDLRWSPDSKHLTFTETHYYPSRFHAPDIGGDRPEPPSSTNLVRMFSFEDRTTRTVVVGENPFLLPKSPLQPMDTPWR